MKDKYQLTKQQNIFLAKKLWDENVYCGMKMENRNVTFPQTKTILEGINVPNVALDDIQAILNMRDAWKFLMNSFDEEVSVYYMCKLNAYVARNEALEWGVLRNGAISISGVDYVPLIPDGAEVIKELHEIVESKQSNTAKALNAFLWGMRRQLFWDGNKRTSLLLANRMLIESGNGILTVKEKDMEKFNVLLTQYYENGNGKVLIQFLYDNAISGIDFP